MRLMLCIAFAVVTSWSAGSAAQETGAPLQFTVPVLPAAAKYLEMLEMPPYLALALENNDLSPSLSSRLEIVNRRSFRIRAGVLTFVKRKDALFTYEAGVNLSLGVGDAKFTIPVEVDVSGLARGNVVVRLFPPLAKMLPKDLVDRIEFKIRTLANLQAQRKLLAYLDGLSKEQASLGRGRDGLIEAILLDAYARKPQAIAAGGDRGRAEAHSDQAILIITLAIWIIGFPVFLFFVRTRRKEQRAA
jgi:hypothetical protein